MAEEQTRRDFLSLIIGAGTLATAGAVLYPVVQYLLPPPSGEANVTQLKLPFTRAELESEPKKSKTFKFGRVLGLILITPTGELRAVAARCTHLDCTVQYRNDLSIIWCSCHNGQYDLEGRNIAGPPPKPLEKFVVNEVGADIFVSRESV